MRCNVSLHMLSNFVPNVFENMYIIFAVQIVKYLLKIMSKYFFLFNFNFYFILLYNTVLVLPYIDMNPPQVYMHSQTWPRIISLDHPRAPAPSILYPALNIDWRFVSYMIVYMLECHSPKSSHPLPLPLCPKVRYTHLCLFSCLAYRVVIAIFLNSIYIC